LYSGLAFCRNADPKQVRLWNRTTRGGRHALAFSGRAWTLARYDALGKVGKERLAGSAPKAEEFTIESRTANAITVRQVGHNHRYIFTVQKLHGRRHLWAGPVFGNAKASVPAMMLMGAARTFAEREARKAEMID
jgi:hypothetical protein